MTISILLLIYILFALINIIVCSILAYLDYNNGEAITIGNMCTIFGMTIISIFGTILIISNLLYRYSDIVILKKKNKKI